MRRIDRIVLHCSATAEERDFSARDIDRMHAARGFRFSPPNAAGLRHIGYHFFVRLDGTIEPGRPVGEAGAHVRGYNLTSIGICYAGGLTKDGKSAKDTRTLQQRDALARLVRELAVTYRIPRSRICGHRDLSPDRDGDGKVERHEWLKECPCFEVADWLREIDL